PPRVSVRVDDSGITVADNGPGIPPETVAGVVDFTVRVSSREAYVSPCRGAQGNALKTVLAMPFVLDRSAGRGVITARGVRHDLTLRVDRIRQTPVIEPRQEDDTQGAGGTQIRVCWPASASRILSDARDRFLQLADDFTFLNPHLTLVVDWFGEQTRVDAGCPGWTKWL